MEQLVLGRLAPVFELPDQEGKFVRLSDFKGSKLLIFFFSQTDDHGTIKQVCSVNLSLWSLARGNMKALGISSDTIENQQQLSQQYGLRFPLLSDPKGETAKTFGAWGEKYGKSGLHKGILRSSFIIDENGHILQENYKIDPCETVTRAEQFLKMY